MNLSLAKEMGFLQVNMFLIVFVFIFCMCVWAGSGVWCIYYFLDEAKKRLRRSENVSMMYVLKNLYLMLYCHSIKTPVHFVLLKHQVLILPHVNIFPQYHLVYLFKVKYLTFSLILVDKRRINIFSKKKLWIKTVKKHDVACANLIPISHWLKQEAVSI